MSRGQDKLLAPQGLARNKSNTPRIISTGLSAVPQFCSIPQLLTLSGCTAGPGLRPPALAAARCASALVRGFESALVLVGGLFRRVSLAGCPVSVAGGSGVLRRVPRLHVLVRLDLYMGYVFPAEYMTGSGFCHPPPSNVFDLGICEYSGRYSELPAWVGRRSRPMISPIAPAWLPSCVEHGGHCPRLCLGAGGRVVQFTLNPPPGLGPPPAYPAITVATAARPIPIPGLDATAATLPPLPQNPTAPVFDPKNPFVFDFANPAPLTAHRAVIAAPWANINAPPFIAQSTDHTPSNHTMPVTVEQPDDNIETAPAHPSETHRFANVTPVRLPNPRGFYNPSDYHCLEAYQVAQLLKAPHEPACFDCYAFGPQQFTDMYQSFSSNFVRLCHQCPPANKVEHALRVKHFLFMARQYHLFDRVIGQLFDSWTHVVIGVDLQPLSVISVSTHRGKKFQ
ncbi:hypothetical protein PCASD_23565 [Puccinia coronata f. sp. avenae]|uniref:Uncharacterized protein n=1 Tax=Puccinia coronata f. sp. avenae TaxID=200324 RepID=A0A2N5SQW4_9BASI|nr:hypothetical protein PCASD_23565 [Puccinia coronata f. sp. avenae]